MLVNFSSENCGRWFNDNGLERGAWQASDDYKKHYKKWSDAEFIEIACISDFKMLTLASETSIYARTTEINCHYLMTRTVCFAVRSLNELMHVK